ncbi:SEC-C metal-binding domain-containing protein [Bacillus sp. AK128]
MKTINRNEACPCGSGKKYKKCCQLKKPTQLTDILSSELALQQEEILYYALEEFEVEIEEMLDSYPTDQMPKEAILILQHFIALDCLFSDETALTNYIRSNGSKLKRPRTKQIVETWERGFSMMAKVVKRESPIHYVVSEVITNKEFSITLLNERDYEIDERLFGFFVPYDSAYTIFTEVLNFTSDDAFHGEQAIKAIYEEEMSDDIETFYMENFITILDTLFFGTVEDLIEDLEWESEAYEQVAELVKLGFDTQGAAKQVAHLAITLWYKFCQRNQPKRIPKPLLYVAAIQYIVDSTIFQDPALSKKEYAEQFKLSPSSLSTKIREIEAVLENELEELRLEISEIDVYSLFDDLHFDEEDDEDDDFYIDDEDEDLPF